jgi:hypothetical protein
MRARGAGVVAFGALMVTLAATQSEGSALAVGEAPAVAAGSGISTGGGLDDEASPDAGGRWHNSILQLDQSATTQTLHVGDDYQSADPTYELWLAVKPRYYLFETAVHSLNVNLWTNLFLELTNSDTTTREHQITFGPTYLTAPYSRVVVDRDIWQTTIAVGPRLTLPTDTGAWSSGQLFGAGAVAEIAQTLPLRGRRARVFRTARLAASAIYGHSFTRSTSAYDSDLYVLRQDVAGRPLVSHVLRGGMLVHDTASLTVAGSVAVTRRLEVSVSYTLLDSWSYGASDDCVTTSTCTAPMSIADPTTFGVKTWLVFAASYRALSELSIDAGYYNLANQLGPDGQRRGPLWSPAARFYLTLTAHLDPIVRRLTAARR